jgi:hypothetical protein
MRLMNVETLSANVRPAAASMMSRFSQMRWKPP